MSAGASPEPSNPDAQASLRISPAVRASLACPREGHAPLAAQGSEFVCTHAACGLRFPIYDGLPVLVDEESSVFRHEDYRVDQRTTLDLRDSKERSIGLAQRVKEAVLRLIPSISIDASDFDAEAALRAVEEALPHPRVLVIGAGDVRFSPAPGTEIVYSDVARGPMIDLIADAHDLPFASGSFDAVLAIAVMQYLPDPPRAMASVHRILRPQGFVYVVAPMIQQNTLGPFDFFLYTPHGLRRVMRSFEEVRSGIANGPGMALGWTFERFMTSFSERRGMRSMLSAFARLLVWPAKHFDRWLARRRGAFDCASALYFFGRRSETAISDRDILSDYRGLNWG